MRHSKKRHKLGRTATHRKATLAALSSSLIAHKRITTTVAKAKALRSFIEPLITRAKDDSQHNRRQVFRHLQDKDAVTTLFTEVSEQVGDRPGGYTRVVKLGRRLGDGARLAMIELVDYNDVPPDEAGGSRRTRRGSGKGRRRSKSKGAAPTAAQPTEPATETDQQVETPEKGVATETVEEDVAEAQAEPVTDRTDADAVPDEQIEVSEEAVDEQKEAAEEPEAKKEAEAPEAEAAESKAEEAEDAKDEAAEEEEEDDEKASK